MIKWHTLLSLFTQLLTEVSPVKGLGLQSENASHSVTSSGLTLQTQPSESCRHRNLQGRILEWVAIPFSSESSQSRD